MQFLRKIFKLGPIEGENSAWPKIDVKKLSHGQPRGVIDDGAPSTTKPEVPRQTGKQDASLTHVDVASRRARAVGAKCIMQACWLDKSRAAISISINFDAPL